MKIIIAILVALQINFASASEQATFQSCESVETIAVLAKDNMPYWARSTDAVATAKCYEIIKEFVNEANDDDIRELEEAFVGQVRVFLQDREFAGFIREQNPQAQPMVIEAAYQSMTPVVKAPQFFFQ